MPLIVFTHNTLGKKVAYLIRTFLHSWEKDKVATIATLMTELGMNQEEVAELLNFLHNSFMNKIQEYKDGN